MFAFLSLYLPTDLLVLAKMTTHCCNFVVDVPQKDHQPILALDLLLGLHPCVIPPITIWSPILSPTSSSTSPQITIITPIWVPTSRTTSSMMSIESDSWSLILITSVIIPISSLSSFPIIPASTWVTLWLLYMFTGLSEWWISCWLALGLVFSYGLSLLGSSSSSLVGPPHLLLRDLSSLLL